MSPYRAALLALVVVAAALIAAAPAGATSDGGVDGTHAAIGATGAQEASAERVTSAERIAPGERVAIGAASAAATANGSTNNSSLGTDISSFMQSSAAEVGGAVETGMWTASFNGTDNRSAQVQLVERRTSQLRQRLTALEAQKAELLAEREDGNVSETAYKAKIGRLVGQINALESAINDTTSRANEVGTDVEGLSDLRTGTENLTGPEIASIANNVTGVTVGNGERGPPEGVGNGNGVGNENGVGNGNGNGESNGNGVGNGNGNGVSNGNGADNGNGESNGNGNVVGNAENGTVVPNETVTPNGTVETPDDVGLVNETTNVSRHGPPSDPANAPLAEKDASTGTATGVPNANAPAIGNRSNAPRFSSVTTVTTDLVEPLADLDSVAAVPDAPAMRIDTV